MDDEKRRLRDEVADLTVAVRELREQLARERACTCRHYCQPVPWWLVNPYPYVGGSLTTSIPNSTITYTTTNALAS